MHQHAHSLSNLISDRAVCQKSVVEKLSTLADYVRWGRSEREKFWSTNHSNLHESVYACVCVWVIVSSRSVIWSFFFCTQHTPPLVILATAVSLLAAFSEKPFVLLKRKAYLIRSLYADWLLICWNFLFWARAGFTANSCVISTKMYETKNNS